ncbi:MAG: hypothetical protein JOZ77_10690 [Candidatus Eremiobacteraeota bacterium]|nr:hypothetical protein [Candidatus Eremiobacteraeota bacterium]
MYVQPLESAINSNPLGSPALNTQAEGTFQGSAPATGDNISRFVPPWMSSESSTMPQFGGGNGGWGSTQSALGPLMSILQQLMQMLQSLMGYGCNPPYGSGNCPPNGPTPCPANGSGCPPYGNERFFQNANGSSEGDPHLSFNGAKWNNMTSQPDLLNSNSFAGGFRISTQVTPPNSNGVTWNQKATVTLNNGATTVSMNNNGDATIDSYGDSIPIAKGQTLQLGNGEAVTYEQNGSLLVSAQNGNGGRIESTLTPEGKGVNVEVTAHDVDLGGTLVNGYERRHGSVSGPIPGPPPGLPTPEPIPPSPEPIGVPMPSPILGPIPSPIEDEPQPLY